MLLVCRSLSQLDFRQLIQVYRESVLESGMRDYPDFSPDRQLLEAEQDFYLFLREFFHVSGAVYLIWESDGIYKSALRLEPYRDGLLIEGLETEPESRRKGYARQLLAALESYAISLGYCVIYSHIGRKNTASLHIHKACGFCKISDSAFYIDGSADNQSFTYKKEVHGT